MLCLVLFNKMLDAEAFVKTVGHFLSTQETWTRIVRDYRGAAEPSKPTSEMVFGGDFLKV